MTVATPERRLHTVQYAIMQLSVIVPAHNEEDCIAGCLQSLHDQTDTDFELIVVDNNSTDETATIAARYTDKVLHETAKGYHNAVGRGIAHSSGELLATCDADTVYDRDWVATIRREFPHGTVGIYGSVGFHDGNPVFRFLCRFFCFTVFMRLMRIIGIDVCNGFNFVFRRDAYEQAGGYGPEIYDGVGLDIHLGLRLKQLGHLHFVPKLRARTSMRRIADQGLWDFVSINLAMYWAFLRGRESARPYEDYNQR